MNETTQNKDAGRFRVVPWLAANGDDTLRLDYDLNEGSVVFDVGGYHGDWAHRIYDKYGCVVHVFEPVREFVDLMKERFRGNDRIKVHGVGLSSRNCTRQVTVDGDASSVYGGGGKPVAELPFVGAADFIQKEGAERIDLIKINIEGGEYELLEHLIETGLIQRVVDIQVQFHDHIEGARARRGRITEALRRTHYPTYEFEFVWENWRRKGCPESLDQAKRIIAELGGQVRTNHQFLRSAKRHHDELGEEAGRCRAEFQKAEKAAHEAAVDLVACRALLEATKRSESYRLGYLLLHPRKSVKIIGSKFRRHRP